MHTGESLAGSGAAGVEADGLRLLAQAMLVSLALHALAFYTLRIHEHPVKAPAPPLSARLSSPAAPVPPAEPIAPRPVARRPAPSAKAAPQRPAPVPALPVMSVEAARPPAEPVLSVPAAPAEPAPAAPGPLAPIGRAEPAPGAGANGPDPGSVARFRLELMEIARRYKRYPRVAQDNNWEGRVELRIAFAESGSISSLTVKKGAGRAVLDDAAQAMIRSAQAQAAIPPALRGKAFVLEIPVDFFLREGER